ncbi:MAG: GntR family transcriptional regulator, partial [Rhodospirillales bacterium]|nr:GntR family transcriptional regulator [Rhodospirillales bacterium]
MLDFQNGRPLQEQIADFFRQQISGGVIPSGCQLPLCPELGRQIGVTGRTVDRAYNLLASEGLLYRRRALGTIVGPPPGSAAGSPSVLPARRTKAPEPPVCLAMTRYPELVMDRDGHPDERGLNASLLPDYVSGLMEGFASLKCRFEIAMVETEETLLHLIRSLVEHGQTRSFIDLSLDAETLEYLLERRVPLVALNRDLSARG